MNKAILGQLLQPIDLLPIASVSADGNGAGVDIQQWEGELAVFLSTKATAGTTPTLDVKLQGSADGSTGWTDIAGGAFAQASDANTSAAVLQKITVRADQVPRYLRAVKDIAGTSAAFLVACFAAGTKQIEG